VRLPRLLAGPGFERSVRRLAIAFVCVVGTVGGAASADAAAHVDHRPLCARFRCQTIASNANVRVVKLTSRQLYGEYLSHVAVWKPSGRTTRLGDYAAFFDGVRLYRFALAGQFVGMATYTGNHETGEIGFTLSRLNVRTGHKEAISSEPLHQGCSPGGAEGTDVPTLVITETGAMAWISENRGFGSGASGGMRVCELPAGAQTPVVLAQSLTIVRDSLALGGHTLYWTQEGKPVSAPLD
jgi:hypothetical protein